MKDKKIFKYLIIVFIIIILITITILLKLNKNTTENKKIDDEEIYKEEDMTLEIDENIYEINQLNTFSMVENIINEKLNGNIFYANKIYFQEPNDEITYRLYIYGEIFNKSNKTAQNAFYAIDFYSSTGTYKYSQQKIDIELSEFQQIATTGEQKYIVDTEINGSFFQNNLTDNQIVKRYFEYYKMLILTNPEKAYSLINEKYKILRFENYNNFYNYVQANLSEFENMEFSKFQINYYENFVQYVSYSSNDDYYIFTASDVMNFTVLLDEYIVDLPQFVTKYEESDVRVKTGLNINKFINGLNDKNYNYLFTLLADSFKNTNNLTTVSELENYLKNNFYDQNEVDYSTFTEQGSYYIYNLTLKNKNGTETKNLRVVMQLEDDTNFKMSFSF